MSNYSPMGLKERRIALGITPAELATAIGTALNTYYRYENGTRILGFNKACTLADKLGCTLDDLRGTSLPEHRHVETAVLPDGSVGGTVVRIEGVPEGWDVD